MKEEIEMFNQILAVEAERLGVEMPPNGLPDAGHLANAIGGML